MTEIEKASIKVIKTQRMKAEHLFLDKAPYQTSQRLKQHSGSWSSYIF